jgi:hypothetical protein
MTLIIRSCYYVIKVYNKILIKDKDNNKKPLNKEININITKPKTNKRLKP